MKKKYQVTLVILSILIAFFTVIEFKYQNYHHVIKASDKSLVFVDENLSINYLNGKMISGNGIIKVHFSVSNISNQDTNYYISLENIVNDNNELTYSLKGSNGNNVDYVPIIADDVIIGNNILIKPGESIGYDLFINNAVNLQMELKVGYEKDYVNSLRDLILSNSTNLVKAKDTFGDTYYYSATANDNYVLINDTLFQIIRINGNNTIRLMTVDSVGTSSFLNDYNQAYLDYNSSSVNKFLNNYYQEHFLSFDSVIDQDYYCSDIKTYNTVNDITYFESYNNLTNDVVNILCDNPYRNKIGLISAFEYRLISDNEKTSFLKKDTMYYTSTYASQGLYQFPNVVTIDNGKVRYDQVSSTELAIYPVINLNKDVYAIGEGTKTNPYKIIYEK